MHFICQYDVYQWYILENSRFYHFSHTVAIATKQGGHQCEKWEVFLHKVEFSDQFEYQWDFWQFCS